jgi:hypothetical protein
MPKKRRTLARRTFELLGEAGPTKVELPERGGFRCEYQIKGLGYRIAKDGKGSDPLQAVILTLAKIGVDLYKSPEAQAKALRWCGELNLGIPVFEAMTAFVPEPKDILVL